MAKQEVLIGDSGALLVSKLKNNFDELYLGSGGLGYIIQPSDDISVSAWWLSMVSSYGIFTIVDDYDFGGASVNLPSGIILYFNGGVWSNGFIVGSNTEIKVLGIRQIFETDLVLNGTWKFEKFLPQYYGAVGDGVIDDTTPFQISINFLNGRPLTVPSGIYLITTITIDSEHTRIYGSGSQYGTSGGSQFISVTANPLFYINASKVYLRDIFLLGNDHADNGLLTQTGIKVYSTGNLRIENVTIWHMGDWGIRCGGIGTIGSYGVLIEKSDISYNTKGGICQLHIYSLLTNIQVNRNLIYRNDISSNGGPGILTRGASNSILENDISTNGDSGILLEGSDILDSTTYSYNTTIERNYMEHNAGGELYFEPWHDPVSGEKHVFGSVYFGHNYLNSALASITKPGVTSHITAKARAGSLPLTGGSTQSWGLVSIVIEDNSTSSLNMNLIDADDLFDPWSRLSTCGGHAPHDRDAAFLNSHNAATSARGEYGNDYFEIDADISLSGVDVTKLFPVVKITQTAPTSTTANPQIVTSGVKNGRKLLIIGSSDVNTMTFNHGNGLSLVGGVSVVLGANDLIEFVFLDGTWYEKYRTNH